MFGAIKRLEKKVRGFDQEKVLDKILADELLRAQMIDLNQKQLHEQGLQADGTSTGEYSFITIGLKSKGDGTEIKGKYGGIPGRSDHITGLDTGITYASMEVETVPEGVIITADDRNGFFDRIDKGLGMTQESKAELLPEIRLRMIEEIKNKITSEKEKVAA